MADKIAVLTGGAGKMGGGICRALEHVGIVSAVLDLDVSRAENAAKALVCDVTDPAACAAAVDEIVQPQILSVHRLSAERAIDGILDVILRGAAQLQS